MSLDKIISYWGIGSGSPKVNPRRIQFVTESGWLGFVATYLKPQIDLGVSRFLLWMPFGQEFDAERDGLRAQSIGKEVFQTRVRFDQYLLAQAAGMKWLTGDFVEAISPLVKSGCQVIAYCGTLGGAPEYEDADDQERLQLVNGSLAPFMAAGCDLAFDTACRSPEWHYVTDLADHLRDQGVRVYCESMPYLSAPHWSHGDVMASESMYQAAAMPTNAGTFVNPKLIRGELVRGIWGAVEPPYKTYVDFYSAVVPKAIADGHSVCIQLRHFLAQQGKLEQLTC
jgi:hypothetical protein